MFLLQYLADEGNLICRNMYIFIESFLHAPRLPDNSSAEEEEHDGASVCPTIMTSSNGLLHSRVPYHEF